jgi:catechol 2,3-dioxygenase-like lactoylglutathione lyase family enzyme
MNTDHGVKNSQFELRGVNHLALVCSDRARTINFYSNVLGMPLVGDIELPGGAGHHFFFDIGKGDLLAFFEFRDAPEAAPGIASPRKNIGVSPDPNDIITAHASMNHVAFDVPAEKIDEYRERLTHQSRPLASPTQRDSQREHYHSFYLLHGSGRHRAGVRRLAAAAGRAV